MAGTEQIIESDEVQEVESTGEYTHEEMGLMLHSMQDFGYNDINRQEKTKTAFMEKVVKYAARVHGIRPSARGWEKKFDREKKKC